MSPTKNLTPGMPRAFRSPVRMAKATPVGGSGTVGASLFDSVAIVRGQYLASMCANVQICKRLQAITISVITTSN